MTAGQNILADLECLQPCTHEEADTRIILHVAHCANQGLHKVAITVDTDLVVLIVGHFNVLGIEELWVSFGTGAHFRHLPIHAILNSLGVKAVPLMLFHSLTGCDTVSRFLGRGKRSAWLAWIACSAVTDSFLTLASQLQEIESAALSQIAWFIIVMYSRTCPATSVDNARKQLFGQGSRTIKNIPPIEAALLQHVKRAVFQAGHVWSQALVPAPHLPSPKLWGCTATDSG